MKLCSFNGLYIYLSMALICVTLNIVEEIMEDFLYVIVKSLVFRATWKFLVILLNEIAIFFQCNCFQVLSKSQYEICVKMIAYVKLGVMAKDILYGLHLS